MNPTETHNEISILQKDLAGMGRRFVNYIIDLASVFLLVFILSTLLYMGNSASFVKTGKGFPFSLAVMAVYFIVLEVTTGKTIGKYITGTRVTDENGDRAAPTKILLRTLIRFIPFEQFSYFGEPCIGWHDKLSKTRVVLGPYRAEGPSEICLSKKKIRIHNVLILVLLLFPYILGLVGIYSSYHFAKYAVSMPEAEKLKFLETEQYKSMHITTVEEFDQYWINMANQIKFPKTVWVYFAITVALFIGLMLFQKWALYGIILYSLYNIGASALWFSPSVQASSGALAGKAAQIVIYLICVVYYSRKKVRQTYTMRS
jgi:uncharacterized RDD family membrane protein YckC